MRQILAKNLGAETVHQEVFEPTWVDPEGVHRSIQLLYSMFVDASEPGSECFLNDMLPGNVSHKSGAFPHCEGFTHQITSQVIPQ